MKNQVVSRSGKSSVRMLLLFCLCLFCINYTTESISYANIVQDSESTKKDAEAGKRNFTLTPDKPLKAELKNNETHVCTIDLAANQFIKIHIFRENISLKIRMLEPEVDLYGDYEPTAESPLPEEILFVSDKAGSNRLEIHSIDKQEATGRYKLIVKELRTASANEKERIINYLAVHKLITEGYALVLQGKKEAKLQAIEKFNTALDLYRIIHEPFREAWTLYLISFVYFELGEFKLSLIYNEQALPIAQMLNERELESMIFGGIGAVKAMLGELRRGIDYMQQARYINRELEDYGAEACMITNLGKYYMTLGEAQTALSYLHQALPIHHKLNRSVWESQTLSGLGMAYASLGEREKALEYYQRALKIERANNNRIGEAAQLLSIGNVYNSLGESRKAIDYYKDALEIARAVGSKNLEAHINRFLALAYKNIGETPKAIELYNNSLQIFREMGTKVSEGLVLTSLGTIYREQGDWKKAYDYLEQSLQIANSESVEVLTSTLFQQAQLERDRGNLKEALAKVTQAISIQEQRRAAINQQDLRTSFFAIIQNYYQLYIELLMKMHKLNKTAGYDIRALQVSEQMRARTLIELLQESSAEIRQGIDADLRERERSLRQLLQGKDQYLIKLRAGKQTQEKETEVIPEVDKLTTEYEAVLSEIRRTSPRYAALTQPQQVSIKEIQELLDANTVLLEYTLCNSNSYLWILDQTSVASYELPKRAEIETLANNLRTLLRAREPKGGETTIQYQQRIRAAKKEYNQEAIRLSQLLLGPVADQIGKKRLIIVADGALHYLPFSALPVPSADNRPLIAEHEIVNLPSATTLLVQRRDQVKTSVGKRTIAIIADPVFSKDDTRVAHLVKAKSKKPVSELVEPLPQAEEEEDLNSARMLRSAEETGLLEESKFSRLVFSRQEATAISSLVAESECKKALDFKANLSTITEPQMSDYHYIHIASHGLLNVDHPELSGIVLSLVNEQGESREGFLKLQDIYNLNLPAEVIVLSACQTGIGKEVKGEGIVGLIRGFMYAGAKRVVASLWKVDDSATAELMKLFYQGMLGEKKLAPAAALREAQLVMMKKKRWQAPFFWAAFTLQGEIN